MLKYFLNLFEFEKKKKMEDGVSQICVIKMLITFLILLRFQFFFSALVWVPGTQVSKTIKMALGKDLTISISEIFQCLK